MKKLLYKFIGWREEGQYRRKKRRRHKSRRGELREEEDCKENEKEKSYRNRWDIN